MSACSFCSYMLMAGFQRPGSERLASPVSGPFPAACRRRRLDSTKTLPAHLPFPANPPPHQVAAAKPVKVRLRGVIHNYSAFVALAIGVMLILEARTTQAKLACLVHPIRKPTMIGVSAAFHRPPGKPGARAFMNKVGPCLGRVGGEVPTNARTLLHPAA